MLGGGEIKQGRMLDFVRPKSVLWKNIAMAKVVMKGQPSNFKVGQEIKVKGGSSARVDTYSD